jgi:CDP-glycerol glycerophosphotransferase
VLWLNGDVVFDPAALAEAVPSIRAGHSVVCVDTAAVGDEEIKYTVDGDGYVRELSKTVSGGLGEAVGINHVAAADRPALAEHLAGCADTDYFERAMETAIAAGRLRFRPLDISRFYAVEVDFPADLERANSRLGTVPRR